MNYFAQPLTADDVRTLQRSLKIPAFAMLRTKEKEFKDLGFDENTQEDVIIDAIVRNPGLLNRPIVVVGDNAVIARPIERALELIK